MNHVTCQLTAKNRDHLRNPTLGNRVWAAFLPCTPTQRIAAISATGAGYTTCSTRQRWFSAWPSTGASLVFLVAEELRHKSNDKNSIAPKIYTSRGLLSVGLLFAQVTCNEYREYDERSRLLSRSTKAAASVYYKLPRVNSLECVLNRNSRCHRLTRTHDVHMG